MMPGVETDRVILQPWGLNGAIPLDLASQE